MPDRYRETSSATREAVNATKPTRSRTKSTTRSRVFYTVPESRIKQPLILLVARSLSEAQGYRCSGDGADACLTPVTPCRTSALLPTPHITITIATTQIILPASNHKHIQSVQYAPITRRSDGPKGKRKHRLLLHAQDTPKEK